MSAYSAALKFTYDIGSLYPIEHFLYFSSPLIEFQYHTSAKLALLLVVLLVKTLIRALLGRWIVKRSKQLFKCLFIRAILGLIPIAAWPEWAIFEYSYKSSRNIWWHFGQFWNALQFKWKLHLLLLGHFFSNNWATLWSIIWSHWSPVTAKVFFWKSDGSNRAKVKA